MDVLIAKFQKLDDESKEELQELLSKDDVDIKMVLEDEYPK